MAIHKLFQCINDPLRRPILDFIFFSPSCDQVLHSTPWVIPFLIARAVVVYLSDYHCATFEGRSLTKNRTSTIAYLASCFADDGQLSLDFLTGGIACSNQLFKRLCTRHHLFKHQDARIRHRENTESISCPEWEAGLLRQCWRKSSSEIGHRFVNDPKLLDLERVADTAL